MKEAWKKYHMVCKLLWKGGWERVYRIYVNGKFLWTHPKQTGSFRTKEAYQIYKQGELFEKSNSKRV